MSSNDDFKAESLDAQQYEPRVDRPAPADGPQEEPQEESKADHGAPSGLKAFRQAIAERLQRTGKVVKAALGRLRTVGSGWLLRLKTRGKLAGEADAEGDEERAERRPRKDKKPVREEPVKAEVPQVAAPQAARSGLHNLIINLLVLVIGAIAGMTFSFSLLSTMVFNQANRIEDQREDIGQLERQVSRIMESEAKFRKENKELQEELRAMEASVAAQNAAKEAALAEAAASPPARSSGKHAPARKTGDCRLDAGNIDGNLNRCLEDFNRR